MAYDEKIIKEAKLLYGLGAPTEEIRIELGLPNRRVIYRWIKRFEWNKDINTNSLLVKTARRLNWLLEKPSEEKTDADRAEALHLGDLLLKLEKAAAFKRGDIPMSVSARGRKPRQKNGTGKRRKRKKGDVRHLTKEVLQEFEDRYFYPHQKIWLKAGEDVKTARRRFILKARQIGATLTFAWEALKTAILKGHDQIFISSTKRQAEVFKAYITLIAQREFDVELVGNPTKLITEHGTVQIYYLSPNSYANSQSGDVYFDEVFYTRNFKKMESIAKPMATLSEYRQTYFGAPTAISHEAYELWSGKRYTKFHKELSIDVLDHKDLFEGRLDQDGYWRCVCTLDSAIEMGWDKADKEQLKIDNPDPKVFANIYNCEFIDDSHSVFKLSKLLNCGVDPLSWFPDFDIDRIERPALNAPVSVGYDPAGIEDNAAISVLSYPQSRAEKFRLYEKQKYRGMVASIQAHKIVDIHERYNVEYLGIDRSGPGLYIPGEVELALRKKEIPQPRTEAIQHSIESKARMVQKMINIIEQQRFEYDENDTDLPLAFMSIRQKADGKNILYYSNRNNEIGHSDEFWSTASAAMCEPMNPPHENQTSGSSVVFSN